MRTRIEWTISVAALALAGCVGTPTPSELLQLHPANPQAAQGTYPPLTPSLMSATNLVMVTPLPDLPEHAHDAQPKPQTPDK